MKLALFYWASLVTQMIKNLPTRQETQSSISGSGRSPREGNGNLPQYSYLWNSMDYRRTWLSNECICMSRWKSLGSLRSLLWSESCLGPASCSFPSWIPSGSTVKATAVSDGLIVMISFAYWFGRQHSSWMPSIRKYLLSIFMLNYTGKCLKS